MSRRTPGEGTIFLRKDGRWQAALQLGGKRATVYGKTKTEAVEKLRALASQARTARHLPDAGKITVAAYLDEWLQQARGRLRPKSHLDYSIMVRNHITPPSEPQGSPGSNRCNWPGSTRPSGRECPPAGSEWSTTSCTNPWATPPDEGCWPPVPLPS